jgi:hypothetical protein
MEVQLHLSLTSVPDGGDWSGLRPGRFTPEDERRRPLIRDPDGPHIWSDTPTIYTQRAVALQQKQD